jgi:hypothetical protein
VTTDCAECQKADPEKDLGLMLGEKPSSSGFGPLILLTSRSAAQPPQPHEQRYHVESGAN